MKNLVNPLVIRDDTHRRIVVRDRGEDLTFLNAQNYAEEFLKKLHESRQWVFYDIKRVNYDMVEVTFEKLED